MIMIYGTHMYAVQASFKFLRPCIYVKNYYASCDNNCTSTLYIVNGIQHDMLFTNNLSWTVLKF